MQLPIQTNSQIYKLSPNIGTFIDKRPKSDAERQNRMIDRFTRMAYLCDSGGGISPHNVKSPQLP